MDLIKLFMEVFPNECPNPTKSEREGGVLIGHPRLVPDIPAIKRSTRKRMENRLVSSYIQRRRTNTKIK